MSISIFPPQQSLIKSIQRGSASSAGNITISAVNISKSFTTSFSTGSQGTAFTSSTTSGTYSPSGGSIAVSSPSFNPAGGSFPNYTGTRTFSGGSTTLSTAAFGSYLSNSTTLVVDGACRWEVVEYN